MITIIVEPKNAIVNTVLPTFTYKVEGLLGGDKLITEPTLTSNADITVIGEYETTATGAYAGNKYTIRYVSAKLNVLTDNAIDAAKDYREELKDFASDTANKDDADAKTDLAETNNSSDTNAPATGDSSNMWLWIALLFISGAVTTLTVYNRKKKKTNS